MSRPPRILFPGAVYHVTSRGDRREPIFLDDLDRCRLLGLIEETTHRFEARVHAWCLMGNHFHLVLQTVQPNLSDLMRHLNGVYTQRFNRRHGKVGHVFQGRFHAVLVDTETYLLRACRYVEQNPVRAGIVADAATWAWSSARARVGTSAPPAWLTPHPFGAGDGAFREYHRFLGEGIEDRPWESGLPSAVPREPQRPARPLAEWLADPRAATPQAVRAAHAEGGWTMTAIAAHLGVSVATVSRRARL